jgi:hypothetical protein
MINTEEQKKFLKEVFREVVLEVMNEEKLSFYDSIFPNANKAESEEIEKHYGLPESYKKDEFMDMTDWINNAG